jgi:hypothetical protein
VYEDFGRKWKFLSYALVIKLYARNDVYVGNFRCSYTLF